MKKILLPILFCFITISIHAEILNIQTSGVIKVANNQTTTYQGSFSFSLDTAKDLLFINNNSNSQSVFYNTGMYTVKHVEKIRDNVMGDALALLISKNNIDYVVTITSRIVSFSRSGETSSLCWHFNIIS